MAPASDREMAVWLAELDQLVARRQQSDDEDELRLEAYLERLQAYPADIVRHVLWAWPEQNRWWPTWAEVHERLERGVAHRRALAQAVKNDRPEQPMLPVHEPDVDLDACLAKVQDATLRAALGRLRSALEA